MRRPETVDLSCHATRAAAEDSAGATNRRSQEQEGRPSQGKVFSFKKSCHVQMVELARGGEKIFVGGREFSRWNKMRRQLTFLTPCLQLEFVHTVFGYFKQTRMRRHMPGYFTPQLKCPNTHVS